MKKKQKFEQDFHTKKKIVLKDFSPDSITIPLKNVIRKNVKPEMMLYNLMKTNNWSDISNIDLQQKLVAIINLIH